MIPEDLDKQYYAHQSAEMYGVPIEVIYSLGRYVNQRIPEGGFMTAILCNDLRDACCRADHINKHRIFNIVDFCWNELPFHCWGSPERVKNWLSRKDENGKAEE